MSDVFPFLVVMAVGAVLIVIGLLLDRYWSSGGNSGDPDTGDAEWARLITAVEGDDWAIWESEVTR